MRIINKLTAVTLAVISLFVFYNIGYAEEHVEDDQSYYSFISFSITLEKGEKFNYKEDSEYNQDYTGETYLYYLYDGLGNSDQRKIVDTEGNEIHALREGNATVQVKSAATDETLCFITVNVKPREADSFYELLDISFDNIKESALNSLAATAGAFLSFLFGITMPFVTIFSFILA